jgi:hypothetical protein
MEHLRGVAGFDPPEFFLGLLLMRTTFLYISFVFQPLIYRSSE